MRQRQHAAARSSGGIGVATPPVAKPGKAADPTVDRIQRTPNPVTRETSAIAIPSNNSHIT